MNETVTIPKAEYERLRAPEEMADIQAALAVEARIASGEEEIVPASVVDRFLDGEAPLRVRGGAGDDQALRGTQASTPPALWADLRAAGLLDPAARARTRGARRRRARALDRFQGGMVGCR